MFNISVNDKKNIYRSKPVMNVDTTGSSTSIPKPLTYDYMPEGYPKKDGWSVEWDGNIDGKINVAGTQIYKFSDMVLTYEDFLSAQYVVYVGGEQVSGMVSEVEPEQTQLADAVSSFRCLSGGVQVVVVSEDNAEYQGAIFPTKGLYVIERIKPFKLIIETITPMSTDFLPKNLNVVFRAATGDVPTSCNVTYDELRGWLESNIPVLAVLNTNNNREIYILGDIFIVGSSIKFGKNSSASALFQYNSDGTFSEAVES